MAVEIMDRILRAEKENAARVTAAKAEAADVLENAEREAEKIINDAGAKAEDETSRILREAGMKADGITAAAENASERCRVDPERFDRAVRAVIDAVLE